MEGHTWSPLHRALEISDISATRLITLNNCIVGRLHCTKLTRQELSSSPLGGY